MAELIADGFEISAMSESAISANVRIALQRETVAFLCTLDQDAPEPTAQSECRLLAGEAYLASWEARQTEAAQRADAIREAAVRDALALVLSVESRRCVIDLGQAMDEAVHAFEAAGLDPADAPDEVRARVFSGYAYTPLGDPSENVMVRASRGDCPPEEAEATLAGIRAARSVEPLVLDMLAAQPDCMIARTALDAQIAERSSALAETGFNRALQRLSQRGLLAETSAQAGATTIRLVKGCP